MSEPCACRTVSLRVLVTAGTFDEARAKAREIADSVRSDGLEYWVTASYPEPVDRMGCLVNDCDRPR